MATKMDKPADVTAEVKVETPKVVIKEAPAEEAPKLSEKTLAEQAAGREALKARQQAAKAN